MQYQRFLLKYGISIVLFSAFIMMFVYITDPLQYYREASWYEGKYSDESRYQMPGLIRQLSFETAIVGTSMTQNFRETHANEVLDTTTLNLALSGSSTREHALVVNLALEEQNIKQVFWEINYGALYKEVDEVADDHAPFPYHMYDNQRWNDVFYLFSLFPLEVLEETIVSNLQGKHAGRDPYELYKFGDDQEPMTLEDVKDYIEAVPSNEPVEERYTLAHMIDNFETNIEPMIRENEDVHFTFFFAPYSIPGQVKSFNDNANFQDRLDFKRWLFKTLSKYEHVSLYDFQAFDEITYDLSNYMDTSHYFSFVNDELMEYMASHPPIQSMEEYEEEIRKLEDQVMNLTVDQLRE